MTERRVDLSEAQAQKIMQQQQQQEAMNEQKESMLRAFLSPEGRERLKRIEQVKPERAAQVEGHIINACPQGKLIPPVGDDVVKELLVSAAGGGAGGEGGQKKITVIRKNMDDDW